MSKPALLLYDPTAGAWVAGLRQLCAVQGLRFRQVEPSLLGCPLGTLAQGLSPAGEPPANPPVPEPMVILCGLTSSQLDRMLSALRRLGAPSTLLKAVLTPDNAGWSLSALYRELCKERLALSRPDHTPRLPR